jgi:hypothetical protein
MEFQPEFVSVEDFARVFSVKPNRVREYISDGRLRAIKLRGVLRIPISELERVKKGGLEAKSETAVEAAA